MSTRASSGEQRLAGVRKVRMAVGSLPKPGSTDCTCRRLHRKRPAPTISTSEIFADSTLAPTPRSDNPSTVEAALRTVDRALDTLCATLGLTAAAA